jgi:hypothetical protein
MVADPVSGLEHKIGVVPEFADAVIAFGAEKAANVLLSRGFVAQVVVVNVKALGACVRAWRFAAQRAYATLLRKALVILCGRHIVVEPEHSVELLVSIDGAAVSKVGGFPATGTAVVAVPVLSVLVERKFVRWKYVLATAANLLSDARAWCGSATGEVDLKPVGQDISAAPNAHSDRLPVVQFTGFGRFGHFVKWLLISPVLNSWWHQPQGTKVGGLPPGCFAGVFLFMEVSI